MAHPWDEVNMDSGALKVEIPSEQWRRKTFNGLAQVLVQSTGEAGVIEVKATSPGLKDGRLSIKTDSSERRAHIK
jgi:beta-galactosidase